jgi:hypothetical protein
MVWKCGPANEYETQSAIIPFWGIIIIIRKEYQLRKQWHFNSQLVATKKEGSLQPATKFAAYSSEPVPALSRK